jgi:hypothetical protein
MARAFVSGGRECLENIKKMRITFATANPIRQKNYFHNSGIPVADVETSGPLCTKPVKLVSKTALQGARSALNLPGSPAQVFMQQPVNHFMTLNRNSMRNAWDLDVSCTGDTNCERLPA